MKQLTVGVVGVVGMQLTIVEVNIVTKTSVKKKVVLPASVIYDKKKIQTFLDSKEVNDIL